MAQHTNMEVRDIDLLFSRQSGYATPKLVPHVIDFVVSL